MLITKIFTAESMHRVVNCSSERCKYSLHGHGAVIEVTMSCQGPDNGGMGYDFGLMKGTIKEFIDSMDHAAIVYNRDEKGYIEFIREFNQRWTMLPVSPSAEFLSAYIFRFLQYILDHTQTSNGERGLKIHSVKYWETKTGSATCFEEDLDIWFPKELMMDVEFSDGVIKDWSDDLKNIIFNNTIVINSPVEQQVESNW